MAEKSEQNDALLTEIRDLIVETYHGAAKELLTQVKDEPPKARLDASKQAALVGRPVEMLHAARLRSQKISAAKQARIAKAVGEEMAMNDDEPWTEDRIERLHAALERRLGAVAQSVEFKSLVRERLDEECRARGAPLVETGGSSDAA